MEDIGVNGEGIEEPNDSIASEGEMQVQKAMEEQKKELKRTKTALEHEEEKAPAEEVDGPFENEADFEAGSVFSTEYG